MDERKKKNKSILITSVIQLIVLILVYFVIAWKEPFPPIPEYGIELSFGLEERNVEATTSPSEEIQQEDAEETPPDQPQEETPQVTKQDPEETEDTSEKEQSEPAAEPTTTVDPLSPDVQPVEKKDEVQPKKETPAEKVQQEKTENNKDKAQEDIKEPDDISAGVPVEEPKIDERALYNESAAGEGENRGATLQMTGWRLAGVPDPDDKSQETGQIIFEIKVDNDGYVVSVKTLTSTVTPAVERLYRNAVQQLVLEKTADNKPAPLSTGKITFILKAR